MKTLLLTAFALLACSSMSTKIIYPGLTAFAKTPDAFEMPIEAAGLAILPEVRLDSATAALFIAYRYVAGSAQRAGEMTLLPDPKNNAHYTGHWRTVEDDGTVYSGDLYLDFELDGTANGEYTFGGGKYDIRVQLK